MKNSASPRDARHSKARAFGSSVARLFCPRPLPSGAVVCGFGLGEEGPAFAVRKACKPLWRKAERL